MRFCNLSREYLKEGYTQVDNVFLLEYLPEADPIYVKVYMYGLFLANSAADFDNNVNTMSVALRIDEEKIIEAFTYWENKGIVTIQDKNPPYEILYNSVKMPLTKSTRYEVREFEAFTTEIYRIWPNINFSANNLEQLFEFITSKKIEPAAVILIMNYYENQKGKLNFSGVLAMAQHFVSQGLLTTAALSAHLDQLEAKVDVVEDIFKPFSKNKSSDYENRELFLRWTDNYGFPVESLEIVRDECKRKGGKTRFIDLIEELYEAKAISPVDVQHYISTENEKIALAKKINEILSVFVRWENTVRFYINPWLNLGFDAEAIELIAQFCLTRSIRDLNRMDELVRRFHQKGLLTKEIIADYMLREKQRDDRILEILSVTSGGEITSFISKSDRDLYRTFINWGFDHDAILAAAQFAVGTAFPMSYLSNRLAVLKEKGIFTPEGVTAFLSEKTSTKQKGTSYNDDVLGGLTKEQIQSTLIDLENLDIDKFDV
ncbi:MAG TPA: hypothetical protein PKX91_05525 [Clostridia bacterium]|jgi:hypothetical protein|nr:hypothetical protein [Clostridia bacterium]